MSKDQLLEGTPRRQPFFYFEELPARAQGPFFAQLLKNIYLHVKACHRNNERMRPDKEIEPEVQKILSSERLGDKVQASYTEEVQASFSGEQDPKDTAMRQRLKRLFKDDDKQGLLRREFEHGICPEYVQSLNN